MRTNEAPIQPYGEGQSAMTGGRQIGITVKLFASYRTGRFTKAYQQYPEGSCILDGLNRLGIAETAPGVVLVNGERAPLSRVLRNGDTLALFPLIAGG